MSKSSTLIIDRTRLAEYIKNNAEKLAQKANVDVRTVKVEAMSGEAQFIQTLDAELVEIPLEEVEAVL